MTPGRTTEAALAELIERAKRVPAATAATLLGRSRHHVLALGADELLDVADLRLPGEARASGL